MPRTEMPCNEDRRAGMATEWLYSLDASVIMARWPNNGDGGFYAAERRMLANHPDPMIRVLVTSYLLQNNDAKERIAQAKQDERARRQSERATTLAALRFEYPELNTTLHGTIEGACADAALRYVESGKRVRLTDCIEWAASRHLIGADVILLALAGDGARAIVAAHEQHAEGARTTTDPDAILVTTSVEHYRAAG